MGYNLWRIVIVKYDEVVIIISCERNGMLDV